MRNSWFHSNVISSENELLEKEQMDRTNRRLKEIENFKFIEKQIEERKNRNNKKIKVKIDDYYQKSLRMKDRYDKYRKQN